ncbi:MAG: nucleotidyltransferase [Clostridiaceae bacterium]|nr:nucleotidyltransferase [Clostridiaceae bacterium]
MATVLGIIAEYNPFHNGHLYQIEEAKRQTGAEYVVAIMSGNFTQRGNTSLINKWTKAQMAIENGVDIVLELPTIYSISSAENFAQGAIKVLDSLKIVDTLCFGTETEDFAALNNIANVLYNEPKEYSAILNHELGKGISFPKARENALMMYLNDIKRYANILSGSNNILGIEYLKALKKLKSDMKPFSVQRKKVYYNDERIIDEFASSTAIRKLVAMEQYDDLRKVMPRNSYMLLKEEIRKGSYVLDLIKYEKEIIYQLRKMTVEEIAQLPDVSEGLENLIKNAANSCNSLMELVNIIKSKRYTQTRIQRILLYILLGITKKDMENSKKVVPYARVLGFNAKGKEMLSDICSINPKIQMVTSVKKFTDMNTNKILRDMLQKDIFATDIYTLGYEYDSWANLDYTSKLIII